MQTPTTHDYYVLIPHATQPRILLLQEEAAWALPHWQTTSLHFWQASDHINNAVHERWQLDAITLRCLLWDTRGHE